MKKIKTKNNFVQVEAQAMTTSKWEELGGNDDSNSQDASMDSR